MRSPATSRAVELARPSRGLLTTSQLRAAGCSQDAAERQVRAGRWQRPARGVYALHDHELTGLDLGYAAGLLSRRRVVISGLVVLRELGLRWIPTSTRVLALVAPEVRTPSSGRVVLRRTADLDQMPTWHRGGLTMATASRAVVDGARELSSLRDVRGVVLGAVADGWAGACDLRLLLDGTQRNGSGLCRRALTDADRGCASPPEAELADALIGCGRPFLLNPLLVLDGQVLGSPDVWFVGLGIGGEVESNERHGSDLATETTYDRHERMTSCGIELVHLSVRRIRGDAAEAAGHLLWRVEGRAALAQPEPRGLVVIPRGPLLR